jgi:hypothetical protein
MPLSTNVAPTGAERPETREFSSLGEPRLSLTAQHVLSVGLFTLFFVLTFAVPLLVGDKVLGDPGDTRFNNYILEHIYRWLSGHPVELFSPPFFYPYPYTLFFSDAHFGSVFVYAIFRLLGFSEYHSFALWYFAAYFATLWATYFVLARLEFSPFVAGVAASMFAFSLPSIAQMSHAQLANRACVPLAIYCTCIALRRADPFSALLAVCCLCTQLLISIYLGIFLLMLMVAFALSFVLIERRNPVRLAGELYTNLLAGRFGAGRFANVATTVLLLCATGAMAAGYRHVSQLYGFERSFGEVTIFLPRLWSYFLTDFAPYQTIVPALAKIQFAGMHEHRMFVGVGGFALFLVGVVALARDRSLASNKDVARALLAALLVLVLVTISVRGYTIYKYLYMVPGFNSIRGISRIGLVMAFPISLVGAAGLIYLLQAKRMVVRFAALVLVGMFFLEVAVAPRDTFDQQADAARVNALAAAARSAAGTVERPILHLVGDPNAETWLPYIDAIMVAQRLGWPTAEGYTGFSLMDPYRTPGCAAALNLYVQFLDWSVKNGRSVDIAAPDLLPEQLLKRTVTTGARKCPPMGPIAGEFKFSNGPPPSAAAAAQVELEEAAVELSSKDLMATVRIKNSSPEYISALSSGPVRLAWRFAEEGTDAGSEGWNTRQAISSDLAPGAVNLNVINTATPSSPGRYRFQVSLVSEWRFWFHDRGMKILTFANPIIVPAQ